LTVSGPTVHDLDNAFVPWCDPALLREESVYATINKVSWFAAKPCALYIRQTRRSHKVAATSRPITLRYSDWMGWIGLIEETSLVPVVHGLSLRDYLIAILNLSNTEIPLRWRSKWLRF